ncbi:MAG: DUF3488 and transglutaminase-like domain-containing protein [Propionicimonas sp.]
MKGAERLSLALLFALLLAAMTLGPLTEDRSYLGLTAVLVSLSIGLGGFARRRNAPALVVGLAKVLPGAGLALLYLPRLPTLASETAQVIAVSVAPMDHHVGVALFSAWLLWVLYLVLDTLAIGLERAGWVFPVLVIPYLVTTLTLPQESHASWFIPIGVGYVVVLSVGTYNTLLSQTEVRRASSLRRGIVVATSLSGVLALAGSLVGFGLLPERLGPALDPNRGGGGVQLGDPSLDLIRNLRSPSDRVVITYRSDRAHYLRMAALPAFDASGFHLIATDLMALPLAVPPGVTGRPPTFETSITVGDLGSEWLPVPWAAKQTSASGDWRYDPRTHAVVAVGSDRKLATRDLSYTVTSWELEPDRNSIAAARAGDPGDGGLTTRLPGGLDPDLTELANDLVERATTDGERALALTDWLTSDAFTYSTDGAPGSTLETLDDFLLSSRSGYCEQFAGSLATLARMINIPSRVVIGFLPGVRAEDQFEVSLRQAHAWTELYFDGLGWVPFDPTPSGATGVTASPTPSDSAAEPSTEPTASPSESPTAQGDPAGSSGPGGVDLVVPLSALLVVIVAVVTPLTVRAGRRWRRLRPGRDTAVMVEDGWDEVRDGVVDAGLAWPPGTPRQVAALLAGHLDEATAAALTELSVHVERTRFAAQPGVSRGVTDLIAQIGSGLQGTRGVRHHLVRRLFPRSVVRW